MSELLTILQLIFLLPYILLRAIYLVLNKYLLGNKNTTADSIGEGKKAYALSTFFWVCLLCWNLYQSQFVSLNYVYACPTNTPTKCYKVQADILSADCADTDWDSRGAYGGECTNPQVSKIYFENAGYISFGYCDLQSKDKWTCYPENSDTGPWNIEFSENIKIRK